VDRPTAHGLHAMHSEPKALLQPWFQHRVAPLLAASMPR
jgi:hypothetical protein